MNSMLLAFGASLLLADPAGPSAFHEPDASFKETMRLLQERYVEPVDEEALYRGAVEGMLAHAGNRKWDLLLTPEEYAELTGAMAGEVVGIGVELRFDADLGVAVVKNVLPGSSAERAALAVGDEILKADGKGFRGKELKDVISAIRGPEGSTVALTLLRDDKVMTRSIRREKVTVASVTDAILPGQVGLIAISGFNQKTPGLVAAALARFQASHVRGLVIDLRGNAGGLFDQAVETAGLFLPKGKTVVTEVKRGGEEVPFQAEKDPLLTGTPLAVLIDEQTASGGEILAVALKESAGARVVGRKSFGKLNVQRLDELPNHWAIKYTVGTFRSPAGEMLDGVGLLPDLEVTLEPGSLDKARAAKDPVERLAADAQLRVAVESLRL